MACTEAILCTEIITPNEFANGAHDVSFVAPL